MGFQGVWITSCENAFGGLRFHWLRISNAPLTKLSLKRSYLEDDPTEAMMNDPEIHQSL
jgi:hypothetical protein